MADERERDEVTGIETTGHEWDGIKELNNPLPRWWLYILYATIVFALVWWVLFPAWPTIDTYSKGVLGWSRLQEFDEEVAAARARQATYLNRIAELEVGEIAETPELRAFAMAGGRSAFAVNCSQCHGSGAAGAPGYPNLNDDDWLWAATWTRSRRPSATASARTTMTPASTTCRPSSWTSGWTRSRSTTSPSTCSPTRTVLAMPRRPRAAR